MSIAWDRMSTERIDDERCSRISRVVELIGRRWASGVLLALARGAERFTEVLAIVDGLSDRMLAVRLKELERAGLVDRVVLPTTPVSVRYRITARGAELIAAMQPLHEYGARWERIDTERIDTEPAGQ